MKYAARAPQHIITDTLFRLRRANVWADVGTGKTGATLDALDQLDLVEDVFPALVIAPLRVAEVTWPDEVAKWDHLGRWRCSPVVGSPNQRFAALDRDANLYTVNFETLPWLVDHYLKGKRRWPFPTVVFDECTRLQGFRLRQGSTQAKAAGQVAHSKVQRWVNLTASPAPNGYRGLWGQNWFIDEGQRLGRTHQAFMDRWFHVGHATHYFADGGSAQVKAVHAHEWAGEEIQGLMSDVTVNVQARDYFPDLKEPIRNIIKVRLPTKARLHYREMEKKFFTEIRGHEIEAVHAASKSIKLLQIASGAVYDAEKAWHEVHTEKLQALKSLVEEVNGANVLVVYHWKPTLARALAAFKQGVLVKTAETIRLWNAGHIRVGFVHPASIGHGVSLQDGGNIICHLDQWWDFERFEQINGRLGPMRQMQSGYDRNVYEHYIVAEGTADDDVMWRHETKGSVQDALRRGMQQRG